jgi:hypothetical protein
MSQRNGILVWGDPQDWNRAACRFLRDCVPQNFRSAIEADPRMYFYAHDTRWEGNQIVCCQDNQKTPGLNELLEEFQQTYRKIRMFHACRTENVNSYLRDGFIVLDVDSQFKKAREIFVTDQFPQITNEHIISAAKELENQGRENRLYFCLDDSELIKHAPHYLKYGSEYISAIATYLTKTTGVDCKKILSDKGLPTVFVCDVPFPWIQKGNLFHLLVELITWNILDPYVVGHEKPSIDFTFTFSSSLPASIIKSYYHPRVEE